MEAEVELVSTDEFAELARTFNLMVHRLRSHLDEVQNRLRGAQYPFRHAHGAISLDEFVRSDAPARHEFEATYRDAATHLDRLFPLYERVLGRLICIAEKVEGSGGAPNPDSARSLEPRSAARPGCELRYRLAARTDDHPDACAATSAG